MRRIVILMGLVIFCYRSFSQGQLVTYLEQIAANKVYIEYLQKGYKIAKDGLTAIGNIKNGHFKLDQDFFESLQSINPRVRNYVKVGGIVSMNIQIIKRRKKAINEARSDDRFRSGELDYIQRVFDRLLADCSVAVDELTVLLTPSELKMSDDERIKRVDRLYDQMESNYWFAQSFSSDLQIMVLQKQRDAKDAAILRKLYGE